MTVHPRISELFDSFQNLKVLIIGDVMVDAYIYGGVQRISPEAPVPVLHVKQKENRLGGAANVALNVQSLGAEPILCSIIGDDLNAETFKGLLKKRGMTAEGIISSRNRTTTVKHRVISNGHHLIRIDEELDQSLEDIDRKALIGHIAQLIKRSDVVIFEDYDKGCIDAEVIKETVSLANQLGKPVAVDPKKRNFLSYENVSLFKPNLKELQEGLNTHIDPMSKESIGSAVDQLRSSIGFENALITLSEHGVYYRHNQEDITFPAHVRSISDVSGAGDTVISIASMALAVGADPKLIAAISNLGGGIVCEYPGVVPIDKQRLMEESSSDSDILAVLQG